LWSWIRCPPEEQTSSARMAAGPQYAPLVETRSGTVLDRMNRS
jgi:hypothetical protein